MIEKIEEVEKQRQGGPNLAVSNFLLITEAFSSFGSKLEETSEIFYNSNGTVWTKISSFLSSESKKAT